MIAAVDTGSSLPSLIKERKEDLISYIQSKKELLTKFIGMMSKLVVSQNQIYCL